VTMIFLKPENMDERHIHRGIEITRTEPFGCYFVRRQKCGDAWIRVYRPISDRTHTPTFQFRWMCGREGDSKVVSGVVRTRRGYDQLAKLKHAIDKAIAALP